MLRPINPIVISNSLGRIVITLASLALLKDIPVKVVQEMHIEASEKMIEFWRISNKKESQKELRIRCCFSLYNHLHAFKSSSQANEQVFPPLLGFQCGIIVRRMMVKLVR